MRFMISYILLAAVTILAGCSEKSVDKQGEARALMELSRQWSGMVGSGELEASIDFWAEDAVMLPPDLPILSGKSSIRDYVMGAAAIPGFKISWEPDSAHISDSGDMAYLIERNIIEVDGEDGQQIVTHGKVVTIWRKDESGEWKNVVDMWNTAPAPDAQ